MTDPLRYRAHAFGLRWHGELPLSLFPPAPEDGAIPDVQVHLGEDLPADWQPPPDGARLSLLPGRFRYAHGREAMIEAIGSKRVEVHRGRNFAGVLPIPFFATFTALLLAMRGRVPLHGTAVELDGEATLICGEAGSGKSTSAARMIERGARLISDDLSILHAFRTAERPVFYAGRRTMRLHEGTAERLAAAVPLVATPEPVMGKMAVAPPQVDPLRAIPLRQIVLLGPVQVAGQVVAQADRADAVLPHLFRPGRMAEMPGQAARLAVLALALRHVTIVHAEKIDAASFSR